MKYRTILIDPPWAQEMAGKYDRRARTRAALPYPTMSVEDIMRLPVGDFADVGCHLWLWTTNAFLRAGFDCLEAWGFTYLAPVTWRKPSGKGNWFAHVTQTMLFGYYGKCQFHLARYLPTCFDGSPRKHSQKPEQSFDLIERVSDPERLEMFARRARLGWHVWGNEVESNIKL